MRSIKKIEKNYLIGKSRTEKTMQSLLRILKTQTDEALKLYNRTHPDKNLNLTEPVFSDYYRPSKDQKFYEMIYVAGGMTLVSFIATRFL